MEKEAGGGDKSRAGWSRSQRRRDDVEVVAGMEWRSAREEFILLPRRRSSGDNKTGENHKGTQVLRLLDLVSVKYSPAIVTER